MWSRGHADVAAAKDDNGVCVVLSNGTRLMGRKGTRKEEMRERHVDFMGAASGGEGRSLAYTSSRMYSSRSSRTTSMVRIVTDKYEQSRATDYISFGDGPPNHVTANQFSDDRLSRLHKKRVFLTLNGILYRRNCRWLVYCVTATLGAQTILKAHIISMCSAAPYIWPRKRCSPPKRFCGRKRHLAWLVSRTARPRDQRVWGRKGFACPSWRSKLRICGRYLL